MRVLLILIILLAGCTERQPSAKARHESPLSANTKPEPQRTHQVGQNQIIAVQVPGELWFESQKCYVFRDLEFKTSSMSCPAGATGQIEPD
jgi:hypothetical protein